MIHSQIALCVHHMRSIHVPHVRVRFHTIDNPDLQCADAKTPESHRPKSQMQTRWFFETVLSLWPKANATHTLLMSVVLLCKVFTEANTQEHVIRLDFHLCNSVCM
jgi:hypothetical protein